MLQHCDCFRYFNVIYVRLISTCRRGKQAFPYEKLKNTLTLEQQNTYDRIKRERIGIHMRGVWYRFTYFCTCVNV